MFKKTKNLQPLLFLFFLWMAAPVFGQDLLQHIPADATFVSAVNPKNLNSKVSLDKLRQYKFYQGMVDMMAMQAGPMSTTVKDVFNEPSMYGMDFMSSSYTYGKIGEESSYFGYLFKLSDAGKFAGFFEGVMGGMMPVEDKGKFKQMSFGPDMALAWTNNMAVIMRGDVTNATPPGQGSWELNEEGEPEFTPEKEEAPKVVLDLTGQINSVLAGSTNSIRNNVRFMQAHNESRDAMLFFDYNYIMQLSEMAQGGGMNAYNPMASYMGMLGDFYKDTYMAMGLNFDPGAVSMDIDMYSNPKMMKLMEQMFRDTKLNKKFLKYIPKKDLLGYMSFAFNVENTAKAYKSFGLDMAKNIPGYGDMAVDILDIIDIAIDEQSLYNLLKGDMMVAITGVKEFEKLITTYEYDEDFNQKEVQKMGKETLPEFTMMMSYGNQNDIMKFFRLGQKARVLIPQGNFFSVSVPDMPMEMFLAMKDGILFLSNNKEFVGNRLSSGYAKKDRISKKHCKMMKKNGFLMFMDIPQMLTTFESMEDSPMAGGPAGSMINKSRESLESVIWKMDKEELSKKMGQNLSLNFISKDVNSLEQMFNYFDQLYGDMMGGQQM